MNRRDFLLAVGATACSGTSRPLEPMPHAPAPDAGVPAGSEIRDLTMTASNLNASPLATRGDVLAQSAGDTVLKWDLATMRVEDKYSLAHEALLLLDNGDLAVFAHRETGCAVHRLDAKGGMKTFATMLCGGFGHNVQLLRARDADTIYCVRREDIALFRMAGLELEMLDSFAFPSRNAKTREQLFSLDDGRIVSDAGFLIRVLALKTPVREVDMERRYPHHLARATGERFWYSRPSSMAESWRLDRLVLTTVADPTLEARAIKLGPARVVHMASHADTLAVLLAVTEPEPAWFVAILDESGEERWRGKVAAGSFALNNVGAVALSATRLVLRGESDALHAWDAKTGAPVAVTAP